MTPQSEPNVAFRAGKAQIKRLLNLCATISLYCAIAEVQTGDPDAWFTTLEQKASMTSQDDQLWLNEMRSSWVCQFDAKTHIGVLVDAENWLWPSLLPLFVQMRIGFMIYWGLSAKEIQNTKRYRCVPDCFCPTEVDIRSASQISTRVLNLDPIAGTFD
jgi:hypothetical protein